MEGWGEERQKLGGRQLFCIMQVRLDCVCAAGKKGLDVGGC